MLEIKLTFAVKDIDQLGNLPYEKDNKFYIKYIKEIWWFFYICTYYKNFFEVNYNKLFENLDLIAILREYQNIKKNENYFNFIYDLHSQNIYII